MYLTLHLGAIDGGHQTYGGIDFVLRRATIVRALLHGWGVTHERGEGFEFGIRSDALRAYVGNNHITDQVRIGFLARNA
jgi:hypothetical protein